MQQPATRETEHSYTAVGQGSIGAPPDAAVPHVVDRTTSPGSNSPTGSATVPKGYYSRTAATFLRKRNPAAEEEVSPGSDSSPASSPTKTGRWDVWTDGRTPWRTDDTAHCSWPGIRSAASETQGRKLWRTGELQKNHPVNVAALQSELTHDVPHRCGDEVLQPVAQDFPAWAPTTPSVATPNNSRAVSQQSSPTRAAAQQHGPWASFPPPAGSLKVEPPTSPRTNLSFPSTPVYSVVPGTFAGQPMQYPAPGGIWPASNEETPATKLSQAAGDVPTKLQAAECEQRRRHVVAPEASSGTVTSQVVHISCRNGAHAATEDDVANSNPTKSGSVQPITAAQKVLGPSITSKQLKELAMRSSQFDLRNHITLYEVVKGLILLPWVITKVMLLIVMVPLFTLVANMLYSWLPRALYILRLIPRPYAEAGVVPGWYTNLMQTIIRVGAVLLLAVFGFYPWAALNGEENIKRAQKERTLLVYNHQSLVDPVILVALMGTGGLAKSGVGSIPLLNALPRALGFLFVKRRGTSDAVTKHTVRGSAAAALVDALQRDTGPLLMVAPEGTTKAQDVLLRFHTGAFVPAHPITPVLVKYHWKHCNVNYGIYPSTYLFAVRLLLQVINMCEVTVLPPYYPSDEEKNNPQLYAANVRALMGSALGFPLVDEGIAEQALLMDHGININWRGDRIVAPWLRQ